MKIRTGFVSNSSSSSFTCDVSGETRSGWDASVRDCDMFECVRGHVFMENYKVENVPEMSRDDMLAMIKRQEGEYYEPDEWAHLDDDEMADKWRDESDYSAREVDCPICSFKNLNRHDAVKYLMIDRGFTEEMLLRELKNRFENYASYEKFLNDNQHKIKLVC